MILNLPSKEIQRLCVLHHVDHLYLFGSALTDDFKQESDVDFLVKFKPIDLFYYFDNYQSLKNALKRLLGREVDLIEEQTVKNPVLRSSIDRNKSLLYG